MAVIISLVIGFALGAITTLMISCILSAKDD